MAKATILPLTLLIRSGMEELISRLGYFALALGTFLEGETSLLLASSLSSAGILKFYYVVLFGFLGSLVSDWFYFLIGRLNGKFFIERRPALKTKLVPVSTFFEKNKFQVLMSYRFLYGFRIIIPLMIGMTNIKPIHFLGFSFAAGLTWSTMVCLIGYFVGLYFKLDQQFFVQNLWLLIIGFASVGLTVGFIVNKIATKRILNQPEL